MRSCSGTRARAEWLSYQYLYCVSIRHSPKRESHGEPKQKEAFYAQKSIVTPFCTRTYFRLDLYLLQFLSLLLLIPCCTSGWTYSTTTEVVLVHLQRADAMEGDDAKVVSRTRYSHATS